MKVSKAFLAVPFFFLLQTPLFANEKIADVMNLVSEQLTALNDVSKLVPKDVAARVFTRSQSRCRGAKIVFGLLDEKKGSLDMGSLVSGEMTPDKFSTVAGQDLENMFKQYTDSLAAAVAAFDAVEKELATQSAAAPEARDFTALKASLTKVTGVMRAAHTAFR